MNKALLAATHKLLYPLIRILIRNGVSYGTFADLARIAYIRVAAREFDLPQRKQTVSRISVITGLSRREVSRLKDKVPAEDPESARKYNRAARVIGGWVRDDRYLDQHGEPRVLPLEGSGRSFSDLVRDFSGNVPARAILDELLRVGAVERLSDNQVRLLVRAYLPQSDQTELFGILGTDIKDLIQTIDHNLKQASDGGERFFQRKVSYSNLPAEVLPKLRLNAKTKGQGLLEAIDRWLSKHDRDVNPEASGTGRKRAGVGIYYFEEDYEDEGGSS